MPDYIGRYRAERVVGSGAFATVWLARDESLDTWVAIKVLADNWSHDEEIRRRFIEEARILWRANSDHIVRIHNVEELEDGRPYFVMDFADRGTLQQRMRDRAVGSAAWPVHEAIDISLAIADGLKVAHALGIVHRDLKPGNIMFQSVPEHHGTGREEKLILTDFGMAKSVARSRGTTIATGTPHYMAPEQAEGKADERSDIYAAGVVLYELLAGRVPFPYDSPGRFFAAQATEPPEPIANLRPSLPKEVAAAVDAALAVDPDRRWPSAEAWATALRAAREAGPGAVAAMEPDAAHTMAPEEIAAARTPPPGDGAPPPGPPPVTPPGPVPVAAAATPPPPAPPPAAPPTGGSGGRRPRWARIVIPVVALLALLGAGVAAIALTGGDTGDAPEVTELLLEPVASVGQDPFTESVVPRAGDAFQIPVDLRVPEELSAALGGAPSAAALASLAGAVAGNLNPPIGSAPELGLPQLDLPSAQPGQVASVAGSAPGLYGGTQLLSVCAKQKLVQFLQENDAKGRAWASVLGIQAAAIPTYVGGLTDVILQADTRVTNHGFAGGAATTIDSVLQAGTAVLIDAFGVPRVRCFCGNPLTEPRPLTTRTPKLSGKKWPGFTLEKTVVVKRTKRVDKFAIDDVLTRNGFVFRVPGTEPSQASLTPGGQPASGDFTWDGTWTTSYGDLTLTQSGSSVTGTYTHDDGQIEATTSGTALTGTWNESPSRQPPDDAGDIEWTLDESLRAFTGRWRYARPGEEWKSDWSGTCTAGACLQNGGGATPPPQATPPPPPPPAPVSNITGQGNVNASTEFPTGEFPASLAADGSRSTSWFSAGPDAGSGTTFVWGPPDGSRRLISKVLVVNNAGHSRSDFRTGFGFGQVTVAVLRGGDVVFEKTFSLPGTPDPNVEVKPQVAGDVVRLFFSGHEDPTCGGISEIVVYGRAM
jgi:hypothetical protein